MKKLLLLSSLFVVFFACKKDDKTRHISNYGQAVDSMNFVFNKTYIFYFDRSTAAGTRRDSDRVIFRANGTISEVANRFDSGSYTYPDTLTFPVNTSFDYDVNFQNMPNQSLFNFYPIADSIRGYLLHDYLNNAVVSVFRTRGTNGTANLKVVPTIADSTSSVVGFIISGK